MIVFVFGILTVRGVRARNSVLREPHTKRTRGLGMELLSAGDGCVDSGTD